MTTIYKVISDGDVLFSTEYISKAHYYRKRIEAAGEALDKCQKIIIKEEKLDDGNENALDICWYIWVDINDGGITSVCACRYDDMLDTDAMRSETEDCYKIVARTYEEMKEKLKQIRNK